MSCFEPEIRILDVIQYLKDQAEEHLHQVFDNGGDEEHLHKAECCFERWNFFAEMKATMLDAICDEDDNIDFYYEDADYLDIKQNIQRAKDLLSMREVIV